MRAAALTLLLASCATPGDERWAGWDRFETALGGYEYRYLAPPFEVVDDAPEGESHLIVESTHDNDALPHLPELPPSYVVRTRPMASGSVESYAAVKLGELVAQGHTPQEPAPLPVESASGLLGSEIYTKDVYARFYRVTYFDLAPTSGVVEVYLEANDDPHMRDVDDLIASFATHP